jgi:hypothetical protein
MEDINNLPKCFNQKNCSCFEDLYITPLNYNESDLLQYTDYNLQELDKYIKIIKLHLKLDEKLNIQDHGCVTASEIAKATDLFLESARRLQTQLLLNQHKGEFFCKQSGEERSVNKVARFYEEIGNLNLKSLQLFNKPSSSLPTKFLTDVLEMHQRCLYMLEQFYTVIHFGRPVYKKNNYNIPLHGFGFK